MINGKGYKSNTQGKTGKNAHRVMFELKKDIADCSRQIYSPVYTDKNGNVQISKYNYYVDDQNDKNGTNNDVFIKGISEKLPGGLADKYIIDKSNWNGNYHLFQYIEAKEDKNQENRVYDNGTINGPIHKVGDQYYVVYENDYPHSIGVPINWLVCDVSII